MVNRTAVLTVENAAIANQGIYSASYMGDTPLHGAWMRLIVRGSLQADIGTQVKQTQKLSVTVSAAEEAVVCAHFFCKCLRVVKQSNNCFFLKLIDFYTL